VVEGRTLSYEIGDLAVVKNPKFKTGRGNQVHKKGGIEEKKGRSEGR